MVAIVHQLYQKARLSDALEQSPTNTVEATIHLLEVVQGRRAHAAFTARTLTAVANMVEAADEKVEIDAVGAPSAYEVLIQALDQPKILDALRERDPLAPARIRGLRARERLLAAEGGTCSVQEVADLLGLTRQAVDKRRKAGKLLAVTMGKQWHVFPAWQFVPSGVLPGVEDVLARRTETRRSDCSRSRTNPCRQSTLYRKLGSCSAMVSCVGESPRATGWHF